MPAGRTQRTDGQKLDRHWVSNMDRVKLTIGKPNDIPIWGTEVGITPEAHDTILDTPFEIMIQTGRFWTDKDGNGYLSGTRTTIIIDDKDRKAAVSSVHQWNAHEPRWIRAAGKPVPARHRKLLSQFLMERWDMGKLRGRISY